MTLVAFIRQDGPPISMEVAVAATGVPPRDLKAEYSAMVGDPKWREDVGRFLTEVATSDREVLEQADGQH